jgi:hypothetical protein
MVKNYIVTLSFFMSLSLTAQIVNIPDANFKDALVNTNCVDNDGIPGGDIDADLNNDGEIQLSEAEAVINGLYVNGRNIGSLEGIESFSNLINLHCESNVLSELDLSQNPILEALHCGGGNLFSSLDVSGITNLRFLDCSYNSLSSLLMNNNSNLEVIYCDSNNLTQIDLSGTPNLIYLACQLNQLTTLDVSDVPNLDGLTCQLNQLTSLDISNNPVLYRLSCRDNNLVNLNVSNGNNINFSSMWAFGNPNLMCIEVDDVTYSNAQSCDQSGGTGWCIDPTAAYNEDCILSTNTIAEPHTITIFPNPTKNRLSIESKELEIDRIRLFSSEGILIKEYISGVEIDVTFLSRGLYFIEFSYEEKTQVKKIIKQ